MNQQRFVERLNAKLNEMKEYNYSINDITPLYQDFVNRRINQFNRIYRVNIRPFLKKYFLKRVKRGDFNRKLFALAIFNNLYNVRMNHIGGYISRELEILSIDDIIVLSYYLAKTFRK